MTLLQLLNQKGFELPGGWRTVYFYVFRILLKKKGTEGGKQLLGRLVDITVEDRRDTTEDSLRIIRENFKQTFKG